MKANLFTTLFTVSLFLAPVTLKAQTNVFDDVIAVSPNHTYLEAALIQEGLDAALQNPSGTFTVFAPDDNAFSELASALNTDINGLLALPDLDQILLYHVLGLTANSSGINNGDIVTPLNATNTIKLTKTGGGMVYANQALVNAADLTTMNGVVHSIDAVILPVETVVDIALDNGFTTLAAAVVQAELLPALCDPLATYTVFAPTNQAFDDLAAALNTDLNGLLALPNLADVLTYHVLGAVVPSADVTNGLVAQPLSNTNSLKFTVTGNSSVYVNHATVTATDIYSENGVVHVLDKVVLPFETIADIAIDNGFTSLTAAVIEAELLPVLTDPFANLTVFAPTNQGFDDLATALGTDINGVLASPNLTEILLYHVLGSVVLSTDLSNGSVPTVNGQNVDIMVGNPVMINDAEVLLADLQANNGVVHVIDAVLVPSLASLTSNSSESFEVYPNPSSGSFRIKGGDFEKVALIDLNGREIANYSFVAGHETIEVDGINPGLYIVLAEQNGKILSSKIQIQ